MHFQKASYASKVGTTALIICKLSPLVENWLLFAVVLWSLSIQRLCEKVQGDTSVAALFEILSPL